jgi:hypothetical protein
MDSYYHELLDVVIRAFAALNATQGSPRTLKRCGYLYEEIARPASSTGRAISFQHL